jgi:hypothetical protein
LVIAWEFAAMNRLAVFVICLAALATLRADPETC